MNRTLLSTAILAALAFPVVAAEEHGHDHAGHDHAGHDHGTAAVHEAKAISLGKVTIANATIEVSRDGEITAGKTIELHVALTTDKLAPKAVRLWIGMDSGKGSVKAKADMHGNHGHAQVEVPDPLPEGAAV
jgi:hypothetical protein